jgi:hypothetical protein
MTVPTVYALVPVAQVNYLGVLSLCTISITLPLTLLSYTLNRVRRCYQLSRDLASAVDEASHKSRIEAVDVFQNLIFDDVLWENHGALGLQFSKTCNAWGS